VDNPALLSRLEQMLAELDHSVETLRGDQSDRGHPADSGSSLSETDRMQATVEAMLRQRRNVIAAIARLKDGTYGLCTTCSRPITPGRLEARPEAARCVICQGKYDRLHR
jgi:DnaK suppressor protein